MKDLHTSTCSQELGDFLSPLKQPDSGQSDSRKSIPMQAQSLNVTGQIPETSGMLGVSPSKPLEVLTWLQEAFRASLSLLPGRGVEIATKGSYGRNALESCATYAPDSHSLRTSQACLPLTEGEPSTESLATFHRSGMICSGIVFQLPPLVRITDGTACGLLPTPSGTSNQGKNHVMGRIDEWGGSSNPFRGTPTGKMRCATFEEWMMGFPTGWTELTRSATPSSRKSRSSSPKQSTNS